jgi:hypothetical protein
MQENDAAVCKEDGEVFPKNGEIYIHDQPKMK